MALPAAQWAALLVAVVGVGLIAAAFAGLLPASRLLVGLVLLVGAMITSGLQLLNRNGGSHKLEDA